jgi:UDPglucose 6-dehydrogenase
MQVCVYGLWHLGTVTAACLAGHFDVVGLDPNAETVAALSAGQPPVAEPGLAELVRQRQAEGRLRFTIDQDEALRKADIVWVAFDTPVDEADRADVAWVLRQAESLFPHLRTGTLVLLSSQLPVGSTRKLEEAYRAAYSNQSVGFAYSPENLRLGSAIRSFTEPDRVVIGVREPTDRTGLCNLMQPFTDRIEWMNVESAEMTKHALNAFLATSVAFMNEVACLCERVGASAKDVERGLKTEARIGPHAYLAPGTAFAGGTLARDVEFLAALGNQEGIPMHLVSGVRASNEIHKSWICRRLQEILGNLRGRSIAVLGLTYKPGTNTLRRSSAVETCRWLADQGAVVAAYDPAIQTLPTELSSVIHLHSSLESTIQGADAVLVATAWPEFRALTADLIVSRTVGRIVLDPSHALALSLSNDSRVRYFAVGICT